MNKEKVINTAIGCVMASHLTMKVKQEAIDTLRNMEDMPVKIHIKNQLDHKIDFCIGMGEYSLESGQQITVDVNDEDVVYLDTLECLCG